MDRPGDQAVDLVERQHHGAHHHRIFQLGLGHRCIQPLALAQLDHRLDVAGANHVRIEDFQIRRQRDALRLCNAVHLFRLGEQDAAGDAAGLADRRRLNGPRLAAFGQDDALVRRLGALDQLVTERRWRQPQFAGIAAALLQPALFDMPGNEVGHLFRALTVIDRNLLVHAVEVGRRVVGAGGHGEHRQPALQRALAQLHDARIGREVAAQQEAGERHAVHGRQARGEDDVVAIAGRDHQHVGLEQRDGIGHGAGAQHDLADAPLFVVAGIEHPRAEQVGHITRARRIQLVRPGDAADQPELLAAQHRRMRLQHVDEFIEAARVAHLVEDHAQHLGVLRPAELLRLDLDAVIELGERLVFRRADQDDVRIQAAGDLRVHPCGVAGMPRRHHAFDDDYVLVLRSLLEQADDFLKQLVHVAFAEHPLDVAEAQRLGRRQAMGTGDQLARTLRAFIAGVGLGDRLEEADLQPVALQRADEAEADGGQADAKAGRRDEKRVHRYSLARRV